MISLSMNLLFGVPALAGPGRLKAGHHTDGTTQTGSWCQCTAPKPRGLSMNLLLGVPALAGPGRLKAGLRADATTQTGSWSQCMRKSEMGLSVNRSFVLVVLFVLVLDSVIWLRGRARGRGRVGS